MNERLQIAESAMIGILSNGPLLHRIMDGDMKLEDVAYGKRVSMIAVYLADSLLAEIETKTTDTMSEIAKTEHEITLLKHKLNQLELELEIA